MIFRSEKGFSLVSTMIAIGLTGILGLIVMQNAELSGNIKSKADSNLAITEINNTIQRALSDRATCSYNLVGKEPGNPDPTKSQISSLAGAFIDPSDYNNFLPSGSELLKINKELDGGIVILKMEVIEDSGKIYLAVHYDTDPKASKKLQGGRTITKRFQLQVVRTGVAIASCYSEVDNLVQTAAVQACRALGGTMVAGKCEYASQLIDPTSASCGADASYKAEVVAGKIRITCTPCTMVKKFITWDCRDDLVKGVNWLNICYYRTGCSGAPAVSYGLQFWEIGGTSASGGDTGSEGNCEDKRHKCAGEP